MQPERNLLQSPIENVQRRNERFGENLHHVFIADHYGITSAFEHIKFKIRNEPNSFLTLIYPIKWLLPIPLYQFELALLERRYPSRLITHYVFNFDMIQMEISEINQQILEVVINSDTSEFMQFQLLGEDELIESVTDRLLFLGIKSNQISSQIFK